MNNIKNRLARTRDEFTAICSDPEILQALKNFALGASAVTIGLLSIAVLRQKSQLETCYQILEERLRLELKARYLDHYMS